MLVRWGNKRINKRSVRSQRKIKYESKVQKIKEALVISNGEATDFG